MAPKKRSKPPVFDAPPKISIIMPVADPRRVTRLARTIIPEVFLQTYRNIELLVINASGLPLFSGSLPQTFREIVVDANTTLSTSSSLRNIGIRGATGELVAFWDDDDYSHMHRLVFQAAHLRPGYCGLLSHEVRLNYPNRSVVLASQLDRGISGTALFPRFCEVGHLAQLDESLLVGDDAIEEMLARCFGSRRLVLRNDDTWFPGPVLHFSVWFGPNNKTAEQFFGPAAKLKKTWQVFGRTEKLKSSYVDYLVKSLAKLGVTLKVD